MPRLPPSLALSAIDVNGCCIITLLKDSSLNNNCLFLRGTNRTRRAGPWFEVSRGVIMFSFDTHKSTMEQKQFYSFRRPNAMKTLCSGYQINPSSPASNHAFITSHLKHKSKSRYPFCSMVPVLSIMSHHLSPFEPHQANRITALTFLALFASLSCLICQILPTSGARLCPR